VKKMLEGVVERGTAENLKNKNYKIAGKTGTAQLADRRYGYRKGKNEVSYLASFVGYFPADNPQYSCIVVVNSPSNLVYYGNVVAGPVFKEIADKIYAISLKTQKGIVYKPKNLRDVPVSKSGAKTDLDYIFNELDIPTQYYGELKSPWIATTKTSNHVKYNNRFVSNKKVPNVVGMGARDAVFILESAGLSVKVTGRGTVVSQSAQAGTAFKKGDKITIELM
jgi:cell division protein FtsI (penicillin-binding protein 3)